MNADVAKFDLTQTNEIRHNNNNRKIRCNPFVRRTHRDQQNISHDAKGIISPFNDDYFKFNLSE